MPSSFLRSQKLDLAPTLMGNWRDLMPPEDEEPEPTLLPKPPAPDLPAGRIPENTIPYRPQEPGTQTSTGAVQPGVKPPPPSPPEVAAPAGQGVPQNGPQPTREEIRPALIPFKAPVVAAPAQAVRPRPALSPPTVGAAVSAAGQQEQIRPALAPTYAPPGAATAPPAVAASASLGQRSTQPDAGQQRAAIAENLKKRELMGKQRQDGLRAQGAEHARQLAQQEALLQPAQQRLDAARQAHAALAGASVRYENRGGGLVSVQSDANGAEKVQPVDPANAQEQGHGADWMRQHAAAKAELTAAEAAHAPLAAGVQALKDKGQTMARNLMEDHRWEQSLRQRMQHAASGDAAPPPAFNPATADRQLLARLQKDGDPMAATVKEEMTPQPVRQFQGKLDKTTPEAGMTMMDVATGGTPGSGARATPAEATAARDLTMKNMGIADPKNVALTPQPDGTQALHRPRSGSSAPYAIYDPKQKSVTLQAQNGTLSEDARRMAQNIAGPPGSAHDASMPVYFGRGPHATEAEFSSLVEAGKQAHEAARTPEERAAALERLGLSPAGVKKQLEAGTLSYQQGRVLNGAFNGVMEHDSTLPGTQAALQEWASDPNHADMGRWLNEGTPEQRAYAASQFFKETRHRAEGSLLATPDRMEEVRRSVLGGFHADWGRPGAAAPGSAPDEGPAGLERIPLKGGGAAHMPSGTWTAHDYETLDQHPDIRKLPHAEREAAVDTLLGEYHDHLAAQPGFDAAGHQKFHQTAQALRDRVAGLKTWGDTAGQGVDLVKDEAKSQVGTHVAAGADLSVFNPDGSWRVPGGNMAAQSRYQAQKAKDTAQRLAQPAAERKIDDALEAIHQDVRSGNFPVAGGEAQKKWIDETSAKYNPQRQQWFDAVQGPADPNTPEGKKHLSHTQEQALASPENRALLQEYLSTGNEARWKELKENLKKTPQRAQTDEDQEKSLKNDPIVGMLSEATGTDFGEHMKNAPGTLVGHFVPGMDKLGKLGKLGKGSRFGRVMRKAAGIGANIGGTVAQNTVENPDATFEDHKQSVLEGYATSLGMRPLQHGVGKVGQKIGDHVQSRRSGAGGEHPGGADGATPQHSEGQTFDERIGLESGATYPGGDNSQPLPDSAQHVIPDSTTKTDAETAPAAAAPPPRRLPTPTETQEAIEGIKRLQDKASTGGLSVAEQRELDQHEKTRATARTHHLEAEKKALSEQNPPRELNPFKAQALENERAVLKRPVPGEPSAASPSVSSIPENTTSNDSGAARQSSTTVNEGQPSSTPPASPVRETDLGKFGDAQKTIEKLKTQQSPLGPDDQKKLDAAEHSVASTIEYNLLRKKAVIEKRGGTLHPTEAGALKKAQDTLARLEPERGNVQPGNGAGNDITTPKPDATQPEHNIHNAQDSNNDSSENSQSEAADIDTFSDHWTPPLKSPNNNLAQTESANDTNAANDGQKKSRDIDGEGELPYWKEYYDEVGRDKENIDPLLMSIRDHGEIMRGPSHRGINIEESNQARYIPTRDNKNQIVGHTITHGPSTKKWEIMEEFAHYRATQGWKNEEINTLKKKLDKGIRTPTGRWEKMKDTKGVAEEIIIKQHLLDHASSLKPADKKLLQNQINQLSRYGFSRRY